MLPISAFWLLLGLPGYALLRRLHPRALEGGALSAAALSYLASFALLSPVSIAGYLFRLPLAVFSIAIVVAVVVALLSLARDLVRHWRWPRPSPVALLASALIAADMLLGLRVGTTLTGDARYHVSRVRMLLSYGFNNWDPFVPGHHFDPVYNTNIYHALMAAAAQITRQSAIDAWVYTWFWVKLAVAAAACHLAFTLLGKRWLGWIAGAMVSLWLATTSTLAYPNSVAAFALLPLGLAFLVELLSGARDLRPALGLAVSGIVLVQVHALYYVFLCMIALPLMVGLLVITGLRRLPLRPALWLAPLLLCVGGLWFAPRIWQRLHPTIQVNAGTQPAAAVDVAPKPAFEEPDWSYKGFIRLEGGRIMSDPAPLLDPSSRYVHLLIALLVGMFSKRRAQLIALSAAVLIVLAVLYVPAICTAVDHAAGGAWIVRRLTAVLAFTALTVVPGAPLLLVVERIPESWAQALGVLLAGVYAVFFVADRAALTHQLAFVRDAGPLHHRLVDHARRRDFYRTNIPRGATVVIAPNKFYDLTQDCDCYPLALPAKRTSHGVTDMAARRDAANELLGPRASLARRVELLRHYGLRHIYLRDGRQLPNLVRMYRPLTVKVASYGRDRLLTLDPNRAGRPE